MGASVVLDASALLALLQGEPGAQAVERHLERGNAVVGAVNLSETVAHLVAAGMPERAVRSALAPLGFTVHDFGDHLAWRAALLRPVTKSHGLGLGDRACLALAQQLGAVAVTADRAWTKLPASVKVRVQMIR